MRTALIIATLGLVLGCSGPGPDPSSETLRPGGKADGTGDACSLTAGPRHVADECSSGDYCRWTAPATSAVSEVQKLVQAWTGEGHGQEVLLSTLPEPVGVCTSIASLEALARELILDQVPHLGEPTFGELWVSSIVAISDAPPMLSTARAQYTLRASFPDREGVVLEIGFDLAGSPIGVEQVHPLEHLTQRTLQGITASVYDFDIHHAHPKVETDVPWTAEEIKAQPGRFTLVGEAVYGSACTQCPGTYHTEEQCPACTEDPHVVEIRQRLAEALDDGTPSDPGIFNVGSWGDFVLFVSVPPGEELRVASAVETLDFVKAIVLK